MADQPQPALRPTETERIQLISTIAAVLAAEYHDLDEKQLLMQQALEACGLKIEKNSVGYYQISTQEGWAEQDTEAQAQQYSTQSATNTLRSDKANMPEKTESSKQADSSDAGLAVLESLGTQLKAHIPQALKEMTAYTNRPEILTKLKEISDQQSPQNIVKLAMTCKSVCQAEEAEEAEEKYSQKQQHIPEKSADTHNPLRYVLGSLALHAALTTESGLTPSRVTQYDAIVGGSPDGQRPIVDLMHRAVQGLDHTLNQAEASQQHSITPSPFSTTPRPGGRHSP